MQSNSEPLTPWRGKFISVKQIGNWEYVSRNVRQEAVAVVAITSDDQVVLVEQYRPPVGATVLEIPAGLVGDIPGSEDEPLLRAAQRELLEETGYESDDWHRLGGCFTTPGLADEKVVLFLALGARRVGEGGGDASEQIKVHLVARGQILPWLEQRGGEFDLKLLAGLYAAGPFLPPAA